MMNQLVTGYRGYTPKLLRRVEGSNRADINGSKPAKLGGGGLGGYSFPPRPSFEGNKRA
jgi:hypothetical protein